MPCEKHGPRASVTTKTSAFGLGFCLLSPSGHVFHMAWETMIKSYNKTVACVNHPSILHNLTHCGLVMSQGVKIWFNIWSSIDSSPLCCQAITWTNTDFLSIGHLGTDFSDFESNHYNFHSRNKIWNHFLQHVNHFVQASMPLHYTAKPIGKWDHKKSPLTHWPLGDLDAILKLQFSILFHWLVSSHRLRILPWDECQGTSPMISQHWFR